MNPFDGIKHFSPTSPSDVWGDPSKMDRSLLLALDQLREFCKCAIYVSSGYRTSGSTADSQHKLGRAVDVLCPGMDLFSFYLAAERFGFQGIGIYPHWKWKNAMIGGLHLDMRTTGPARWMGVLSPVGQTYVALNPQHLKDYGVIQWVG
jgi:uncharacterized protein YcbK (DUF882 family)